MKRLFRIFGAAAMLVLTLSVTIACKSEEAGLPAAAGRITGPTEVLSGSSIELSIAEIEGAATYKWYKNDIEVQNTSSRTLVVATDGTYRVAGANEAGQGALSSAHVVTLIIPKNAPGPAGAISGPTEIRDDSPILLSIEEIEGADTYRWFRNDAEMQNTSSRTLSVTEAGTYRVAGVNEAGQGAPSPDHVVILNLLPAAAGTVVQRETGTGTYILSCDAVGRAEFYRWYKDGVVCVDNDDDHSIEIRITEYGDYQVAGVNGAGEGRKSPVLTIVPPITPDPEPKCFMNQFSFDGVTYNINHTSFIFNELDGVCEIHLLDGIDQPTGYSHRIVWQLPRELFSGRTTDLTTLELPWKLEYYDSYASYIQETPAPALTEPGGKMRKGAIKATLDAASQTVRIVAEMTFTDDAGSKKFEINFMGPIGGLPKEELTDTTIQSVDELAGIWYVSEQYVDMPVWLMKLTSYTIMITKIDDTTIEISNLNGKPSAEPYKVRAKLNGNKELEFGVHPNVAPSWNQPMITCLLPVPDGFNLNANPLPVADLWNTSFPPQKFSRGATSGRLKLAITTGNTHVWTTLTIANYVVVYKHSESDDTETPEWSKIVVGDTVWTKAQ